MDKTIFVDTNTLLSTHFNVSDYSKVFMSIVTIEELDHLKQSDKIGYQARQAIRNLKSANNIEIIFNSNYSGVTRFLEHGNDNTILSSAYDVCLCNKDCVFITDDYNLYIKAKALGIPCQMFEFNDDKQEYTGYQEYQLTSEEIAELYEHPHDNVYNLHINEYLIARNQSYEVIEIAKWTNDGLVRIKSDGKRGKNNYFETKYFGKFKPRDEYQMMAMDSLINDDLTLLYGRAGSCKTYMSLSWIMQNIHNGKLSKCVIIFNPAKLKNNDQLGFYPGSRSEKLMSTSLGGILSSKFGDITLVESLIANGKLMLIPTCDIRGIEISDQDCIYLTEGQNTDAYTMRTIIQRAKEKCKIIIEGDMLEQQDIKINNIRESGMYRTIEVFKGTQYFSCVELQKIYRSPLAELAQNI